MPRFPVFLLLLLLPLSALGQGFVVDVPGSASVPMAVPSPTAPSGGTAEARVLWETLRQDLDMSGYFKLIDPAAHIEGADAGVEPGSFRMEDWTILNASVLVKTRYLAPGDARCDPTGKKACADAYVYYVVNGDRLLSIRYRADAQNTRHLAHRIANAVLQAVTGRPGFFGIQLAAVGFQSGNKEVYVLGLDGHSARPATRNGSINLSPAWSNDGRQIAWTSYKKSNPDLYVKDLPSGKTRVLSNLVGINTSPAWHPDGSRIAMARSQSGDSDIFILDSRTGAVIEQVTRGGGIDVAPSWSSDGQLLAFASERSGGSQVYIKDYQTGETRRVSFVGNFNTDPVISPDGDRIAFVGRSKGGFDVYVSDLDGRNAIRITQDMGDNEDPSWSPDGLYLLFSSTRSGRSELWMATADGRHQVQITRTGGWTQPTFAPIGG